MFKHIITGSCLTADNLLRAMEVLMVKSEFEFNTVWFWRFPFSNSVLPCSHALQLVTFIRKSWSYLTSRLSFYIALWSFSLFSLACINIPFEIALIFYMDNSLRVRPLSPIVTLFRVRICREMKNACSFWIAKTEELSSESKCLLIVC